MKIAYCLPLLLLVSSPAHAIDSIELRNSYQENTRLEISMESTSDMGMTFEGDTDKLPEGLRGKFPGKMTSRGIMEETINTGNKSEDGSFPIDVLIKKQKQYLSVNGSPEQEAPGKLEGVSMRGIMNADKTVRLIEASGGKLEKELDVNAIAKTVLEQIGKMASTIQKVRIGESTVSHMPIQVPIANQGSMQLDVETKQTLKSIKGDLAYFDITVTLNMSADAKELHVTATATGGGLGVYNHRRGYYPENTTDMSMEIDIPMFGGTYKVSSTSHSHMVTVYNATR